MTKPQDLTGDPVFDFLKHFPLPGFKLVGANIVENAVTGPKEARTVIAMVFQNEKQPDTYRDVKYNYKKIERMLKVKKVTA